MHLGDHLKSGFWDQMKGMDPLNWTNENNSFFPFDYARNIVYDSAVLAVLPSKSVPLVNHLNPWRLLSLLVMSTISHA